MISKESQKITDEEIIENYLSGKISNAVFLWFCDNISGFKPKYEKYIPVREKMDRFREYITIRENNVRFAFSFDKIKDKVQELQEGFNSLLDQIGWIMFPGVGYQAQSLLTRAGVKEGEKEGSIINTDNEDLIRKMTELWNDTKKLGLEFYMDIEFEPLYFLTFTTKRIIGKDFQEFNDNMIREALKNGKIKKVEIEFFE